MLRTPVYKRFLGTARQLNGTEDAVNPNCQRYFSELSERSTSCISTDLFRHSAFGMMAERRVGICVWYTTCIQAKQASWIGDIKRGYASYFQRIYRSKEAFRTQSLLLGNETGSETASFQESLGRSLRKGLTSLFLASSSEHQGTYVTFGLRAIIDCG